MKKHEPTQEEMDRHFAEERAASIRAVPTAYITEESRAEYIRRTLAGEDVNAYHSGPGEGVWNLWDIDTRIALPPLEKVWEVLAAHHSGDGTWRVAVRRRHEGRDFTVHIGLHPSYDQGGGGYASDRYKARAGRIIREMVNHCALFDMDPQRLDGTQH